MAEYIEREAAMDMFGDVPMWQGYYEPYPWEVHCAIVGIVKLLKEEISKIPAADIDRPTKSQFKRMAAQMDYAPVVHGHWIHEKAEGGFDLWKCSRCGAGTDQNPEDILLYCFHCGAEMDGGDDGETD